MAVKIPPKVIISLVMVALVVITIFGFFAQIFTGPEYTAARDLAEEINRACGETQGFVTTASFFLPDSKGTNPPNIDYFFLAIDSDHLLLMARRYGVETGKLTAKFRDFTACVCSKTVKVFGAPSLLCNCKEGIRELAKYDLDQCRKKNIQICYSDTDCSKFQMESDIGEEFLDFTIERQATKVILGYSRKAICGDGICASSEDENNCPQDCK